MYTRLFTSILDSSLWCLDSNARCVWITLLASADRKGCVFATVPGLARRANVPLADARAAIELFMSPDPESGDIERAPEHEGRRLEKIDGGWRLLNHEHYSTLHSAEERRVRANDRLRRHREGKKTGVSSAPESVSSAPESVSSAPESVSSKRAYNITLPPTPPLPPALAPEGGQRAGAPARPLPPQGEQSAPLAPADHAAAFVQFFRATVYPGKAWPLSLPSAEVAAARELLAVYELSHLEALARFIAADKPRHGWRGWRAIAGSVTALRTYREKIDAQAFGGLSEPLSMDASVVWGELDNSLRQRDAGLALDSPSSGDRLALNEACAKYGRDRLRVCLRVAFESDRFAKRVRDVETLIADLPALISESADYWQAFQGKRLPPVDEPAAEGGATE